MSDERWYGDLIPPKFLDATVDQPVVQRWVDAVLSGETARLLLLGPSHSGKTHLAYAAVRALLDGGHQVAGVAFHRASDLGRTYEPELIDDGPPVIVVDDATLSVDINAGVAPQYMGVDPPDIQAMMAVERGRRADAVIRLAMRADASWIVCASGVEQLESVLGGGAARAVVEAAEVVVLEKRPFDRVLEW